MTSTTTPRRILWHSDAPWATSGFAGQTRLVVRSLCDAGFDVVLSAAAGCEGGIAEWQGMTVLPSPSHLPNSLGAWAREFVSEDRGDLVITLVNTWRLARDDLRGLPVLSWVPIDSEPAPRADVDHFLATGNRPIAMSDFGASQLSTAGLAAPTVVPHGVDTVTFRPLVENRRKDSMIAAREKLGIKPRAFVVGVVAMNNDRELNRKSLPEIVEAVVAHAQAEGPVVVYLHTDVTGRDGGMDLRPLLRRATENSITPIQFLTTDDTSYRRGLGGEALNCIYNSLDVLCAPSAGEGFCLPLLEAQACGVPVIASSFSAQPESVFLGNLVDGQRRWDNERGVFLQTPTISGIAEALTARRAAGVDGWDEAVAFARSRSHDHRFNDHWRQLVGEG